MRTYIEFAKKKFMVNMAYRFENITGLFSTCLQVFVNWCLYRALYGKNTVYDGITFSMLITNFIISFVIGNAFAIDDFFLQSKVRDGSIANEFLRPINFKGRILAESLGESAFALIFQGVPALIITKWVFGMESPKDLSAFLLFIASIVFGYLILWCISFIVQVTSFWIINVWSVATIKNVLIDVLAGVFLPLWFLPDALRTFISFTPFESIYFSPIQLYLGRVEASEILLIFARQIFWIAILYAIGEILWRKGQKKLIVQGG